MIPRIRHLHEDRLFDCYIAERSGESVDPVAAAHLTVCSDCVSRLAEFSASMEGLREEAEAEADAIFTPDQLRLQHQHILRRIEHLGHPARVISFPAHFMRRHLTATASRIAPRWAAAAAAVGLFVGVGVGLLVDARTHMTTAATATPPAILTASVPAASAPAAPILDVDAFLSELEAALGGPSHQELLPFDALTPRVQEISSRPLPD